MLGETGDRWRKLCEQAASEQNPGRLLELIREINQLLTLKEDRLKFRGNGHKPDEQMAQGADQISR
jgi:hypothetical protein